MKFTTFFGWSYDVSDCFRAMPLADRAANFFYIVFAHRHKVCDVLTCVRLYDMHKVGGKWWEDVTYESRESLNTDSKYNVRYVMRQKRARERKIELNLFARRLKS